MTNYKLTYFDFSGGRAEPVRIAFHAAGIEFEDHRISFDEFMKTRDTMRFRCAPVLEIDGTVVTQSNSMLRYVGKMADLYPSDSIQARTENGARKTG
jgi:glutathione S-transferase